MSYLLLVDYDFPPELHDHLDWAPPARMKVVKGLYGPRTADMAERLSLFPSPCEKLVPFLGVHVEEQAAQVPAGGRQGLEAAQGLPGKHSERRQLTAGSVVAEKVVKLTQNAIFGRCCMNPDKFRNTNAYVDPAKFERAVGKSSVTNFELQINDSEGFLAFVETLKTDRSKACMSVPPKSAPARCSSPSS